MQTVPGNHGQVHHSPQSDFGSEFAPLFLGERARCVATKFAPHRALSFLYAVVSVSEPNIDGTVVGASENVWNAKRISREWLFSYQIGISHVRG